MFQEHPVEWTREKASRFWSFLARNARDEEYFSCAVGAHVVLEAKRAGTPLTGRVLDYGCGPGHLLAHLVEHGGSYEGVDFNADSVEATRRRMQHYSAFKSARQISSLPSTLESNAYDALFFIETIEHLIGDDLDASLRELHRVIRPGGFIVATTPNEEDLAASNRMCPDCGCVFHPIQHVSSWSRRSLTAIMKKHGFEAVVCRALSFRRNPRLEPLASLADKVRSRPARNLLFVGRKLSVRDVGV